VSNWQFKTWYKEHGSELNADRRDRYKSDPEYKKQVLEANRESRRRRRASQLEVRAAERKVQKVKTGRQWKEVEMEVDGKMVKFLTIGALASILGRSKLGVRGLEKKGIIETTPYRNPQHERLYTPEKVLEIRQTLAAKGMLERKKTTGIPEFVHCRVKLSDGSLVTCPLFRIGIMAKAVGRSTITLEQMERRKAIPSTPLRLPPNRRVFTAAQIEVVKNAFDRRGGDLRVDTDKTLLREEILAEWAELKLIGAKVVEVNVPAP
jgi:DNA-binding transcriptional MerR regulator